MDVPKTGSCNVQGFFHDANLSKTESAQVGYSDDDYEVPNMTWWTQSGAAQMMDEKDAQEALALLDQNKRTLKDARDRQHQVRMSRKYNTRCLRCGGDHKTFQRPKPGPGVYMLTPSFPRQRWSLKERRCCTRKTGVSSPQQEPPCSALATPARIDAYRRHR